MCQECDRLEQELSTQKFHAILCRAQASQAPVGEQFEAIRALNDAEMRLKAAEEDLIAHAAEHAAGDGRK